MPKRGYKVAAVLAITIMLVLAIAGVALAAKWSDITPSVLSGYALTEQNLVNISDGYADGTWKPTANMTRAHFAKMSAKAYGPISAELAGYIAAPGAAVFNDVASTSEFFPYIQGEFKMGMVQGTSDSFFSPNNTITRQQAAAIIARFVAKVKGWDLQTFKTDAQVASILENFPDAEAVYPGLKREVAFAITMGILQGTGSGDTLMIAPTRAMTRIEGAAMITRSLTLAQGPPNPEQLVPVKVALVSTDKSENLIDLTHQYTFVVTDKDGKPVPGALVDFSTQQSPWYVGNVSPSASLTGVDGKTTVNLVSSEVGTQRVSAAIGNVTNPANALATATKYWLALDEVYIRDATLQSQNNAGVPHTWQAQVIVFGPGPLSTDQQDWYNLIANVISSPPAALDGIDGFDHGLGLSWTPLQWDPTNYSQELIWTAHGYHARSMAGIPVKWTVLTAPAQITKIDGVAATGTSGWGATDALGRSTVEINSTVAASSKVSAVADYAGNPYPGKLFNHHTGGPDAGDHSVDWNDQPAPFAIATKTWIPHTIDGGGDSPISPSFIAPNIGERKILTITLKDTFGNPVVGKEVTWIMEGVGQFDTDDDRSTSSATDPTKNIDIDNTDALGQAQVFVESNKPGEQVVIAKLQQKPQNNSEPPYLTYSAVVQWFDVNVATFDDPTTPKTNEAVSTNPVGGTHPFTIHVYGLKLEKAELPWDLQNQTPYIDGDQQGNAMDGQFNALDAAYYGGILLVNPNDLGTGATFNGTQVLTNPNPKSVTVRGKTMVLDLVGGYTGYDWNKDGLIEDFTGQTGIYMPLAGKTVTFAVSNGTPGRSNLGVMFGGADASAVGTVTPPSAVTGDQGTATATVASNLKGPETIEGTVDWPDNPHDGNELIKAYAKKLWQAVAPSDIKVSIDSTVVATKLLGVLDKNVTNMVNVNGSADATSNPALFGTGNISVHVVDQFGNDLPDYEVVYNLIDVGGTTASGGQDAADTYIPHAYLADRTPKDPNTTRPDSNEPTPASDPYALIVGPGGTKAFFFNQLAGSDNPNFGDNLPAFPGQFEAGNSGVPYDQTTNPGQDASYNPTVDLVTDGAKAWTLDGYSLNSDNNLLVNTLTGSNVDLVLAENPALVDNPNLPGFQPYTHFKSLVKIFVYAPADGLVQGGTPIWSTTIHKSWEVPVATTITLSPASQVKVAGLESATVTGVVLDQFGAPVVGQVVNVATTKLEGVLTNAPAATYTTDSLGKITMTWNQAIGDWGVQSIVATAGAATSNTALVDWALWDIDSVYTQANIGTTSVLLKASTDFPAWDSKTASVSLTAGGTVLGTGIYDALNNVVVNVAHTWPVIPEFFFVHFAGTNLDLAPNYVYNMSTGFGGPVG
jgi:Bacterial Ig-like domain (group 1)/S-layer homology domain